jgi:hypothetical protein
MLGVDMPEKENSDYYNISLREENDITKRILSEFKKENKFYERALNLLYEVVNCLYQLKPRPFDSTFAILTMLPRLFGTIQSIRVLTVKGYYYDALILERSVVENLGLCVYLAKNEKEAKRWLTGKDIRMPKINIFNEFFSLISQDAEKRDSRGKALYGELSQYVHATLKAIGPTYVMNIGDIIDQSSKVEYVFPPFFDEKLVSHFALYPMLTLTMLVELFKEDLKDRYLNKILKCLGDYASAASKERETLSDEKS